METFLNAIGEALNAVLGWVKSVFEIVGEFLGISEWVVFFAAIAIIGMIIKLIFKKRR